MPRPSCEKIAADRFGDAQLAMRVGSTFNIALRALRRNKMRSVLTALGIIIGVAAVIAMVGIGNGAKAQVEAQIASLGQNVILIFSGSTTSSGIRTGWGGAGTLKIEDAEAIRREVPGVIAVSEEVVSTTQVAAGNQNWFTRIYGESADYFDIRAMAAGRRRAVHRPGRAQREQGLRDRPNDRVADLRQRRSGRPDLADQECAVHDHRRFDAERIEHAGRRSGRHRDHALHQRDETRDRRHDVAQHQRASRRRAARSPRPNSRSSRCCASVITFGPGATTISPCATSRKSPTPRPRRPR